MMRRVIPQQYLRQKIEQGFNRWLTKRMPSCAQQQLSQRNVFIFPSRFGLAFLVFIILLFVLATNYQNNLILLMSYLFSSLFITSMLASFINISGLTIAAKGQYLGYVGQDIFVPVTLVTKSSRYHLTLSFFHGTGKQLLSVKQKTIVKVPVSYNKRGKYQLPRLTIASYYPLGLFRCWTHLQFDLSMVVCPQPLSCLTHSAGHYFYQQDAETASAANSPVSDNFYELRSYVAGESLNQVAWKHLAKTGQWYSKSYQALAIKPDMLSLEQLTGTTIETKLRQLCFLILEYERADLDYGLALAGELIEPAHGHHHMQSCLTKVATYGQR